MRMQPKQAEARHAGTWMGQEPCWVLLAARGRVTLWVWKLLPSASALCPRARAGLGTHLNAAVASHGPPGERGQGAASSPVHICPLTRGAGQIHRPGFRACPPPLALAPTNCCGICHLRNAGDGGHNGDRKTGWAAFPAVLRAH